jgi:hypothetical protein
VVIPVIPRLSVNVNVPSAPTVFFTTMMDPGGSVLVNVQVVVTPAVTVMAPMVDELLQIALVCVQPAGKVWLRSYEPGVRPLMVWVAVPETVVIGDAAAKLLVIGNAPFPFTAVITNVMEPPGGGTVVKVQL